MKAYQPPQQPPHRPPHMPPHPMAGVHPIMPYPPMAYGPPPPHYMPGMPYPPPPAPMPPLVPTTKPIGEAKKADDAAPAGSTKETTKGAKATTSGEEKKDEDGKGKTAGGLDLLASLALPTKKDKKDDKSPAAPKEEGQEEGMPPLSAPFDPKNPNAAAIAILQKESKNKKKKTRGIEEMNPKEKLFVDKVRESDVLCGRGGKSNHHPGNKRYRQVVSEMKRTYQGTGAKTAKTDLSRAIVEHVVSYGGRFIKRDESTGQYFLLTKAQARRKTSQALRETKELKWTM